MLAKRLLNDRSIDAGRDRLVRGGRRHAQRRPRRLVVRSGERVIAGGQNVVSHGVDRDLSIGEAGTLIGVR
jgi:hypothetical protein